VKSAVIVAHCFILESVPPGTGRLILGIAFGCQLCTAQSAQEPFKIGSVTVQGNVRTRIEGWQWFGGQANSDYAFSGSYLRLTFSHPSERFDWLLEWEAPILIGLPGDAVAPGAQGQLGLGGTYYLANRGSQNAAMVFPMQGFVRFKKLFGSESNSFRIGRFQFADGGEATPKDPTLALIKGTRINQRLIGTFTYTHVQRGFYGAHFQHDTPNLNWTVMGAFPTRGVFQVDGWGLMKTAFAYASVTRQLPGDKNSAEWRLFGIYYGDWRDVLKADSRPLAARQADTNPIQMGTIGGHFLQSALTDFGTTDLVLWAALQFGRWGVLDQRAAAFDVEAGLQPPVLRPLKPWIRFGYTFGSGDGNPKDGTNGTFFQLMPTPRQYALYPFFNMMNNVDRFGMFTVRPWKSLSLRHEFHSLRLASRSDLWYLGGGAFQPWTFGFSGRPANNHLGLANLYDLSADYTFNAHASMAAYWGYAVGHAVIASVYPRNKNGSLGFIEFNFKF
jgi:hypothetical protein